MKTKDLFFFAFIFLLTFSYGEAQKGDPLLLKDAHSNKQVDMAIRGVSKDIGKLASGTHTGQCIEFEVKNLTGTSLEIKVEAGRKLICDFDSVQNMMITRELIFTLSPRESVKHKAYAMCIEQSDASPSGTSTFYMGDMASSHLLELAQTLDKYNYQNMVGQTAVWTVIGDKDTSNIWGSNAEQKKFLRKYISDLRSESTEEVFYQQGPVIYLESEEYNISGSIRWDMKKKGPASLIVYDEQGNYVTSVFKERKFDAGNQTYDFKVVSCLFEPGTKYLVRLKIKDLTQEELVVYTE